eukprot:12712800-Alexandrium_andersonii.AAC.1
MSIRATALRQLRTATDDAHMVVPARAGQRWRLLVLAPFLTGARATAICFRRTSASTSNRAQGVMPAEPSCAPECWNSGQPPTTTLRGS